MNHLAEHSFQLAVAIAMIVCVCFLARNFFDVFLKK